MHFKQMVDQSGTAVALYAALDQVIDETLTVCKVELTTVQALAQKVEFDFNQLTQHNSTDRVIRHYAHTRQQCWFEVLG
jgi:hypothetical protein